MAFLILVKIEWHALMYRFPRSAILCKLASEVSRAEASASLYGKAIFTITSRSAAEKACSPSMKPYVAAEREYERGIRVLLDHTKQAKTYRRD